MKKLATKITPAIKEWIKEEFGSSYYETKKEFLSEISTKKMPIIQVMLMTGEWVDYIGKYRIKPTPNYSREIEALQLKAKENGMKATIIFEKI